MQNESGGGRAVVSPQLQSALVHLVGVQLGQRSLLEVVHDVARLAAVTIPDVDEVSLTVVEDGWSPTTAFTGALAAALDERQYADGFGPALTATGSGTTVRVDDTANEVRFSDFAAIARRQGVTSVLALNLPILGGTAGGLCLYRRYGAEPVSQATEDIARTFAGYTAAVLDGAARLASREREIGHLQTAAQTRPVIDQAKGVVMYRSACDADEAFRRLAKQSQRTNRKLRDVAIDIVAASARGEPLPELL